jgi:hypothetical protein
METLSILRKDIKQVEVTDELINRNKEYQKLCEIYDSYSELIDKLSLIKGQEKEVKKLNEMQNVIGKKAYELCHKTNEEQYFMKLAKATMAIKAVS